MADCEREASVLAAMNHPNIVRFFGLSTSKDGTSYIVTELCKGSVLDLLQKETLSPNDKLSMYENSWKFLVLSS